MINDYLLVNFIIFRTVIAHLHLIFVTPRSQTSFFFVDLASCKSRPATANFRRLISCCSRSSRSILGRLAGFLGGNFRSFGEAAGKRDVMMKGENCYAIYNAVNVVTRLS